MLQTKSTISLIHYEILKKSVLKALKDKGNGLRGNLQMGSFSREPQKEK